MHGGISPTSLLPLLYFYLVPHEWIRRGLSLHSRELCQVLTFSFYCRLNVCESVCVSAAGWEWLRLYPSSHSEVTGLLSAHVKQNPFYKESKMRGTMKAEMYKRGGPDFIIYPGGEVEKVENICIFGSV